MHNFFNQSFEDHFENEIFCNLLIFLNFMQCNNVWFVASFLLQSISMSVNNELFIIIIINSYILVTLIKLTHEKLYAIYIEWTKLSEIENHSSSIRLLHAVETIIMRLCFKLVHVDHTLENEWLSHFKLLQKLHFHHHSHSSSETFCDSDDLLIVQEVNVL